MALDGLIRVLSFGLLSTNLTAAVTMRRAKRSWQRASQATLERFI